MQIFGVKFFLQPIIQHKFAHVIYHDLSLVNKKKSETFCFRKFCDRQPPTRTASTHYRYNCQNRRGEIFCRTAYPSFIRESSPMIPTKIEEMRNIIYIYSRARNLRSL